MVTRRDRIAAGIAALAAAALPLAACSGDDAGTSVSPGGQSSSETPSVGVDHGAASSATPNPDQAAVPVHWRDALATATDEFDGKPVSIKLKNERGTWQYKIELFARGTEFEARIDASSGKVISSKSDDESDERIVDLDGIIEPSRAVAAALGEVPGRVSEWKIENDHGRTIIQVEIETSGDEVEVDVDATTGEVLDVDR
ncbi:PepSY domain-containing protein [Gordonia shandongensis]|uniref:PepSY domain-containing protein n=1 Tax=Gordonia shandongensis TaxID=376351 RepID=UPI00146DBD38|nr:PepSY domain-containing protein [Gordonia shandongensis]